MAVNYQLNDIAQAIDVAFVANDNKLIGSKHDLEFANLIADALGDAQFLVGEVQRLAKELEIALAISSSHVVATYTDVVIASLEAMQPAPSAATVAVAHYVEVTCDRCAGIGTFKCNMCDGDGFIEADSFDGHDVDCPECKGEGRVDCLQCKGTGKMEVERTDTVAVAGGEVPTLTQLAIIRVAQTDDDLGQATGDEKDLTALEDMGLLRHYNYQDKGRGPVIETRWYLTVAGEDLDTPAPVPAPQDGAVPSTLHVPMCPRCSIDKGETHWMLFKDARRQVGDVIYYTWMCPSCRCSIDEPATPAIHTTPIDTPPAPATAAGKAVRLSKAQSSVMFTLAQPDTWVQPNGVMYRRNVLLGKSCWASSATIAVLRRKGLLVEADNPWMKEYGIHAAWQVARR